MELSHRLVLRRGMKTSLLAIAIWHALGAASRADEWPNWNGTFHDGISRETGFSDTWPEAGLPVEWTHQIGIGFSSMSVVGDRLFAMGHKDGEETVWCLSASSGDVLWTHTYPSALIPNLHEGGPCSTATVDKDRVYTLGKEGQLYCLSVADGKVVWEVKLQEALGVKLPEWGFSSSPLILGNQLILEAGRVASFDKISGKVLWQTDVHDAGYGSAMPFEHKGKTLLATLDCDGLRVVDSSDGQQIAFTEWKSPYRTNATTPIVVQDTIFVSTGYNIGCGLFRLEDQSLNVVYKNTSMRNHFNNSILQEGRLYGFDGNSHNSRNATLSCINFETGEPAWTQRGLGCGSLLIADGKLLVLSEKGELIMAKASPDAWTELARSPFLEGRCWTVPVLANGRLYGRNADGKLVCVTLPKARSQQ
jgi:outer membrane protein assembly factor BamB